MKYRIALCVSPDPVENGIAYWKTENDFPAALAHNGSRYAVFSTYMQRFYAFGFYRYDKNGIQTLRSPKIHC